MTTAKPDDGFVCASYPGCTNRVSMAGAFCASCAMTEHEMDLAEESIDLKAMYEETMYNNECRIRFDRLVCGGTYTVHESGAKIIGQMWADKDGNLHFLEQAGQNWFEPNVVNHDTAGHPK